MVAHAVVTSIAYPRNRLFEILLCLMKVVLSVTNVRSQCCS